MLARTAVCGFLVIVGTAVWLAAMFGPDDTTFTTPATAAVAAGALMTLAEVHQWRNRSAPAGPDPLPERPRAEELSRGREPGRLPRVDGRR